MIERTRELAWIPEHLDDLDADFARFYRCDWQSLPGPRFIARAERTFHYGGVMTDRLAQWRAERETTPAVEDGDDTLPPLPTGAVMAHPSAMADLIQVG